MAWPKGKSRPATSGRRKGTPNKSTAQLKDMILGALDDAGGQRYLCEQAKSNPNAFLALIGRVLPTTLTGPTGEPPKFTLELPWLNKALTARNWGSTPTSQEGHS